MKRITKIYYEGTKCDLPYVTNGIVNCGDCFEGEVIDRLAAYEDAEEQGRLVVLPCKVGDTVFEPNKRGLISTYKIISVHFSNCSTLIGWTLIDGIYSNLNGFALSALGKTVFLTRQEAEKALEGMQNG